jgi:transcriptional regulator with XRE-family HTH domain
MASHTEESPLPVDLSAEPLVGWRCWFVLPHELLLRPIYKRGLVWKPREPLQAVCPDDLHEVPADGCKCGVWTVCHPMLLDEIGWTTAPPKGIDKLPGVMVVGEVSLWGNIVQHERGWRASFAYPRHLYVFTDDPMIAETLRERYGVPVEWGADAERLRRFLPGEDPEDNEPAPTPDPAKLAEILLGVVDAGLVPAEIRGLVVQALKDQAADIDKAPSDRIKEAQQALTRTWYSREDRQAFRRRLGLAAAEEQALNHASYLDGSRAAWVRLVRWQRARGEAKRTEMVGWIRWRDEVLDDLARGTHRTTGQPYARGTLACKRSNLKTYERWIAQAASEIEPLMAVEIPTYRAWRAMMAGLIVARSVRHEAPPATEELRACHQALMRRHERLAGQERLLALERARLIGDRGAFEERQRMAEAKLLQDRETLESERGQLREDVLAGVKRDHAELLAEVGELERRRRAALAMLPGPWAPDHRINAAPGRASSPGAGESKCDNNPEPIVATPRTDLLERMRALGISQRQLAAAAGIGASNVSRALAGRTKSARVLEAAEVLIVRAEAGASTPTEATLPAGPGHVGVGHPALSERLRVAGIIHADVAAASGCSRALVSHVLSGRTGEARGKTVTIVQTAERLLAEAAGHAVDSSPAPSSPASRSVSTVRDALVRERAELDELRRAVLAEREQANVFTRHVAEQQRRLDVEKQKLARTAEAARLRHIAAGLPRRLELAGITRTQLANAARRDLSQVSRVLAGYATSPHIIEVAERLLARGSGRRSRKAQVAQGMRVSASGRRRGTKRQ